MFSVASPPSEKVTNQRTLGSSFPVFLGIFALLLLLSVHGVKYVPFYEYTGLDLENLFQFHTICPEWPIPYGKTGAECGDPLNRAMIYPPLGYWAMAWLRIFTFYPAKIFWMVAIVSLTALATWLTSREEKKIQSWSWPLWILLLLQMPMVYAAERGNIDVVVIIVFCLGIYFFGEQKTFFAGVLFATASWLKVYPVIPAFLILAATFLDRDLRRTDFRPLLKGFLLGGIAWAIILLPDSYRYVFEVLPRFSAERGGFGVSSHSLYRGMASLFLKVPLLVLWTYWAVRMLRRDTTFTLCALLAISTFFQNTSNDYNLITAYPFLFLVLNRLLNREMTRLDYGLLILTFVAFVGDRTPLEFVFKNRGALFAQIVWFIWFPLYVLNRIDKGRWADGNLSVR